MLVKEHEDGSLVTVDIEGILAIKGWSDLSVGTIVQPGQVPSIVLRLIIVFKLHYT